MPGGLNSPLLDPSKILIIMIIAVILVIGATVALNGGTTLDTVEEDNNTTVNDTNVTNIVAIPSQTIGSNDMGSVTKMGPYGNSSSDKRVALIVGVDQKENTSNSIVPTLESMENLKYSYDIYMINTTNNENTNTSENNTNNLTTNDKSESLANEYAVADIISKNYKMTVDIHGVDDSNSYIFVPSEIAKNSNNMVKHISNETSVGRYTPEQASYTSAVSLPILRSDTASFVYVTNDYYNSGISDEISSVISAIDSFVFGDTVNNTVTTNDTYGNDTYDDVNNDSSDNYQNNNQSNNVSYELND